MTAAAYALVRNGSVDGAEVERVGATVVDVVLTWGDGADRTVLAVKHVEEGQSLTLGEEDALPLPSMKLVERKGGKTFVMAPPESQLRLDGWPKTDASIELGEGHVAELSMGLFHLRFALVPAAKKVPLAMRVSRTLVGVILASVALHMGIVGVGAMFGSRMAADDDTTDRDNQRLVAALVDAPMDPEQKQIIDDGTTDPGGSSTAAPGVGQAGPKDAPVQHGQLSIAGDATKPHALSRAEQLEDASQFGMIGLVGMMNTQLQGGANQPWGNDLNGSDETTHFASMLGGIDDAAGSGGLGLTGIGEGGNNGPGGFIGMGRIGQGTLGRCTTAECVDHINWGRGPGHDAPKLLPISMREQPVTTFGGHLPADVIQRIIRQRSGAFTNCYQAGLRTNPELAGRVGVSFMIDRSGAVSYVADAGSDLPDQNVRSCIVSTFRGMSFPAPEGGTVRVSYGLSLAPSNA